MHIRIILEFLCFFVVGSNALSCKKCNETVCDEVESCTGSTVYDSCGCCYVCAKQEKEICGGPWNVLGKCDSGLACAGVLDEILVSAKSLDQIYKATLGSTFDQSVGLCQVYYDNCSQACEHTYSSNNFSSGFSTTGRSAVFLNERNGRGYNAYCDCTEGKNNAWMVVQRRTDFIEDFDRSWTEYQSGFGDANKDYWLGLDMMNQLTSSHPHELEIVMKYDDSSKSKSRYGFFLVENTATQYRLSIKKSGAQDGFVNTHDGMKFTTTDFDNDRWNRGNCADWYRGGWWFNSCTGFNLNGVYYYNTPEVPGPDRIMWNYSVASIAMLEMKIRPLKINKA